jgi:hypothetical protein
MCATPAGRRTSTTAFGLPHIAALLLLLIPLSGCGGHDGHNEAISPFVGIWSGSWQGSSQGGTIRLAITTDGSAGGEVKGFNGATDTFQGRLTNDGNLSATLADATGNLPMTAKVEKYNKSEGIKGSFTIGSGSTSVTADYKATPDATGPTPTPTPG